MVWRWMALAVWCRLKERSQAHLVVTLAHSSFHLAIYFLQASPKLSSDASFSQIIPFRSSSRFSPHSPVQPCPQTQQANLISCQQHGVHVDIYPAFSVALPTPLQRDLASPSVLVISLRDAWGRSLDGRADRCLRCRTRFRCRMRRRCGRMMAFLVHSGFLCELWRHTARHRLGRHEVRRL